MDTIPVNLGERSYDIQIGSGLIKKLDVSQLGANQYVIITDSNVKQLYGNALTKQLASQGSVNIFEIQAGEDSKTLQVSESIARKLASANIDKKSLLITLGGGVVGDIGGLIASIYKRGIRYIHIPTTLLAQVDSSIGGKTAVNLPEGKNLIGTIYQPERVVIDVDVLQSLPEKEIRNGLAEVIKYGVILDASLFEYLEQNINRRDTEFYAEIVKKSCTLKAKIVEQDEEESEVRKILNYGHTIGHAIEVATDHKVTHGEAISVGMAYEGKIALELKLWTAEELERQNDLIGAVGLPTVHKSEVEKLIEIMKKDKKNKNGELHFILPTSIGKVKQENSLVAFPVGIEVVRKALGTSHIL